MTIKNECCMDIKYTQQHSKSISLYSQLLTLSYQMRLSNNKNIDWKWFYNSGSLLSASGLRMLLEILDMQYLWLFEWWETVLSYLNQWISWWSMTNILFASSNLPFSFGVFWIFTRKQSYRATWKSCFSSIDRQLLMIFGWKELGVWDCILDFLISVFYEYRYWWTSNHARWLWKLTEY